MHEAISIFSNADIDGPRGESGQSLLGKFWKSQSAGARSAIVSAGCWLGSVWILAGLFVWFVDYNAVSEARNTAHNTSYMVSAYVTQTLKAGSIVLDSMHTLLKENDVETDEQYRALMKEARIHRILRNRIAGLQQIDKAAFISLDGEVLNFSLAFPAPRINVADRDYFKEQMGDNAPPTTLSMVVQDRGSGKWTFYLAQKLRSSQGRTIGLAIVGIQASILADYFRQTTIGDSTATFLVRNDGVLLTGSGVSTEAYGKKYEEMMWQDATARPILVRHAPSVPTEFGPTSHIVSVHPVQGEPAFVAVVIGEHGYFANWWQWIGMIAALTVIASVIIVVALCRMRRLIADAELAERVTKDRRMLAAIVNTRSALTAVVGTGGEVIHCNERFREVFGVDSAGPFSLNDPAISGAEHITGFAGAELPAAIDIQVQRTDGPSKLLHFSLSREWLPDIGECVVLVGSDETLRRRAEQAIAESGKLAAARDAAEAANRAKSQFLANMSHELRTPLNGILGMLGLARQNTLDADTRQFVDTAEHSANHLLAIVNDILDLSKLEADRLTIEKSDLSVRSLVDSTLSIMKADANKRGNSISASVSRAVPDNVEGDEGRIRQVLLNLLSNAVKFTQNGSISVEVDAIDRGDGTHVLQFKVVDTGIGISGIDRAGLFQQFSQADSSIRRRFGGAGLGLAISRRLVTLMGGSIDVMSEPGRGSTFCFEIPCRRLAARAMPSSANTPVALPRLRVLAVEDVPTNQLLLQHLLARDGHDYDIANNGVEALEAARMRRYDAILMDVQMPDMDGVEATRRIRELAAPHGTVPIIMITANAMAGDQERYLAAGATEYISKPIKMPALREALARATQFAPRPQTGKLEQ
jgi:signal transduction histidine kinase/ActR/RegA family two-component response regulator